MATIPPEPSTNVIPFEIPPETPVLPHGESHIPPNSYFAVASPIPAPQPDLTPSYSAETLALMRAPNAEQLAQIQAMYKVDEQALILAWWPHIYLRPSEHVTDKPIACTAAHVLAHAKGEDRKSHGKRSNGDPVAIPTAYATLHMQWVAECGARKRWIEAKKADWQKRREEKAKWKAEQAVTEAQWDAYIDEAKKIYKDAEAYPIPERPVRT
jgi:hypothetical protein